MNSMSAPKPKAVHDHSMMNSQSSLTVKSVDLPVVFQYVENSQLEAELVKGYVLAAVRYDYAAGVSILHDAPCMTVPATSLGTPHYAEVWRSATPVSVQQTGNIISSSNEELMFAGAVVEDDQNMQALTREVYSDLIRYCEESDFPRLLRMWNYIPKINDERSGMERYKEFCVGRHEVFSERNQDYIQDIPAASALGTPSGGLIVYCLAARSAGDQIENPRQISAYNYPPQYGPCSPSFTRAMVKQWPKGIDLYISGTASIVGHESHHLENVSEQLEETLRNVAVLAESATSNESKPIQTVEEMSLLKVYIRHPEHYEVIRDTLEKVTKGRVPVMYLQADICRTNLLLEIEAVYHSVKS